MVGTPGIDLRPINRDDLEAIAHEWPVSPRTPKDVENQLDVARKLFTHSLLVWEFGAVAVAWSLLAVESGLRVALDATESSSFHQLIDKAATIGVLDEQLRSELHQTRRLRNSFAYPRAQPVGPRGWPQAVLRSSHAAVATIFDSGVTDHP